MRVVYPVKVEIDPAVPIATYSYPYWNGDEFGLTSSSSAVANGTNDNFALFNGSGGLKETGTNNQKIYGSSSNIYIQTNATYGVSVSKSLAVGGLTPSTVAGRIDASNDVVAYSSSDIRLKENIKLIEDPIEKINKIGGYEFDWSTSTKDIHGYDGHDIGVIAQEIEKILPEIVTTRENGYKAVKYDKLTALLIEAVKELSKQVVDLRSQIDQINGKQDC